MGRRRPRDLHLGTGGASRRAACCLARGGIARDPSVKLCREGRQKVVAVVEPLRPPLGNVSERAAELLLHCSDQTHAWFGSN